MEGVAEWLETHKTLPIVDATIVSITSSRYELQSSRKVAASTTNLQVDLGGKTNLRPRECRKPRECHVNYDACPASSSSGLYLPTPPSRSPLSCMLVYQGKPPFLPGLPWSMTLEGQAVWTPVPPTFGQHSRSLNEQNYTIKQEKKDDSSV